MDAGAARGGVEDEAGGGMGVVADFGSLVSGQGGGGVGVARGDDGEAGCAKGGTKARGEGEGDVFFEEAVGEMGSGVRASVGGIEEDEGARSGLLGCGQWDDARCKDEEKARGAVSAGRGQRIEWSRL